MTEWTTAEIIAFPQRKATVVCVSPIAAATAELGRALTEQHEALVAWQGALTGLRDSLHHLGHKLQTLDQTPRHGIGLLRGQERSRQPSAASAKLE